MPLLSSLATFVRGRRLLRRAAQSVVRLIPDRRITINVPQLGRLRIRMRRHRHLLWERFGETDSLALATFKRLLRPGEVAYDIGANIGIYTRFMVQWLDTARVIAFEPMAENFELLEANIALGGVAQRVHAFPIALSDADGVEELQIDDMTSGTAVLNSVSEGKASAGRREFGLLPLLETVNIARLDGFIERENLPPPHFMKIDTEGAEVKVLRGAIQTLRRHKPRLAIALHDTDKTISTLDLLEGLGYFCFGFAGPGHTWRQLHAPDAEALVNNNIVASCILDDVRDEVVPHA